MQRVTVTICANGKHEVTNDRKRTAPPYCRTVNKATTPHLLTHTQHVREVGKLDGKLPAPPHNHK